jgi:hypothetical protein
MVLANIFLLFLFSTYTSKTVNLANLLKKFFTAFFIRISYELLLFQLKMR